MHREGHIGIGMIWYAPIAYILVEHGSLTVFGLGLVAVGFWSFAPDFDMVLPIRHRGPTHSFPMAVLAGLLTAASAVYLNANGLIHSLSGAGVGTFAAAMGFAFAIGFLGVVGHIVGDVLTPMGVEPFWPVTRWNTSLALVLASDKEANQRLATAGAVACGVAVVIGEVGLSAFIP